MYIYKNTSYKYFYNCINIFNYRYIYKSINTYNFSIVLVLWNVFARVKNILLFCLYLLSLCYKKIPSTYTMVLEKYSEPTLAVYFLHIFLSKVVFILRYWLLYVTNHNNIIQYNFVVGWYLYFHVRMHRPDLYDQ